MSGKNFMSYGDADTILTEFSNDIKSRVSTKANQGLTAQQMANAKANIGIDKVPNVATNDQTPTFLEESTRTNIASGDKLSLIFGKIKKFFSDLKAVAFSGSYNDLSDTPLKMVDDMEGYLELETYEVEDGEGHVVDRGRYYTPNIGQTSGTVCDGGDSRFGYLYNSNKQHHFQFGVDANGNYGYVKKVAGADTVIPFKTVGTRSGAITANGTYTAKTDISKDGYESVTVSVSPNLQSKTVTAGTTNVTVSPDASYEGLSSVVVQPTPSQTKSVTPSTSAQTVSPDSGKLLSSVSVGAIPNQHMTNSMIVPKWGTGSGSSVPATRVATLNPRVDFNNSNTYGSAEMVEVAMPLGYYNWSYGNSSCCIPTETKTVTASMSSQTVTPTGYNSSGNYVKFLKSVTVNPDVVKIWTNSSPNASFSTKDITIPGGISSYKFIFVRFKHTTTATQFETIVGINVSNYNKYDIAPITNIGTLSNVMTPAHCAGTNSIWRPIVYVNNTTIRFERPLYLVGKSDGGVTLAYNTSGANHGHCIPLECYGVKA